MASFTRKTQTYNETKRVFLYAPSLNNWFATILNLIFPKQILISPSTDSGMLSTVLKLTKIEFEIIIASIQILLKKSFVKSSKKADIAIYIGIKYRNDINAFSECLHGNIIMIILENT